MDTRKAKLLLVLLLLLVSACSAQKSRTDRQPAVAGAFYPGTRGELEGMLNDLFSRALPSRVSGDVVAIIVPHAGYVYSGEVAASGYNTIDRTKKYDNIFIIGPSHYVGFEGASVYTAGNYLTPLGSAEVNTELGKRLIHENPVFSDRTDAHAREHSVEVQVPFLQHILAKHFRIVPIVVGENSPGTCKAVAAALRPYLNNRNLFVISSDFSHYPAYNDAVRVDEATADAVLSNSPENLIETMEKNGKSGVPNLATSLCGWSAVLTLLYMTAGGTGRKFTKVQYQNSGDSQAGEKDRVVGYNAIAVSEEKKGAGKDPDPQEKKGAGKDATPDAKKGAGKDAAPDAKKGTGKDAAPDAKKGGGKGAVQEAKKAAGSETFSLSAAEKETLLAIARRTVEEYVLHGNVPEVDPAKLTSALRTPCGAFVTLNEHSQLRGCIGRFDADEPLYRVVQAMAVASATQDYRFNPVEPSEVKNIRIEISVLTPMRKISSIDQFELGKQGIYMRKGTHAGTFLPQVAEETHWTKEEFLGHCAQDKAGIGWDGWKDADLYVYEALVFGEPEG